MAQPVYMLRSVHTIVWHLSGASDQAPWKTLCTTPIRGTAERLRLPDQPRSHDVLCSRCQEIRRAQKEVRVKAVAAAIESRYGEMGLPGGRRGGRRRNTEVVERAEDAELEGYAVAAVGK